MLVALAHGGALLATCDQRQTSIQLRDIPTGELVATLHSPIPNHITELAFSPDDTQIAVAHFGTRELLLWDLRLLRQGLKDLGLDWARPSFPPTGVDSAPKTVHFRVLKFGDAPVTSESLEAEVSNRRASGVAHTQHGRFAEAADDFAKVIELSPEDHEVWHFQAAVLVQLGQIDRYRELCAKSQQRFGSTTDPNTAERIAKDYLILPGSGPGLETAAKMAQTAVSAPTNHPDLTWFRLAKGLAEYRQGRFVSAVDYTRQVLAQAGYIRERDIEAYMVLAMAQYRCNQSTDAGVTLAKGVEMAERTLPKLESGDLGAGWLDWVIAQALLREAQALIQSTPASAAR